MGKSTTLGCSPNKASLKKKSEPYARVMRSTPGPLHSRPVLCHRRLGNGSSNRPKAQDFRPQDPLVRWGFKVKASFSLYLGQYFLDPNMVLNVKGSFIKAKDLHLRWLQLRLTNLNSGPLCVESFICSRPPSYDGVAFLLTWTKSCTT